MDADTAILQQIGGADLMGWYNGGVWAGLDGTEIPYVLAELANAVNQRRDCLGASRVAWSVNTGTEASPTTGTKSANLSPTDYFGLEFNKADFLGTIMAEVNSLLSPSGGFNSATRHSGFALSGTNGGIGADGDLWSSESIRVDAGISAAGDVDGTFWAYRAEYCREALNRMLYPVIYPSAEIIAGMEYYFHGYEGDPPRDPHDVENIWDHTKGYPAWRASEGAGPATSTFLLAEVRAIGDLISNPPPVYVPYYAVFVHPGATWEMSNLNNESGAGYLGTVATQWASMSCARPGFDIADDTNSVPVSFLGGSENIVHGLVEFTTSTLIPLDGTIESDFVTHIMGSPNNPFNGVRTTTTGGVTAGGVGYAAASLNFKSITSGFGTTNTGFRHVRQILDIAAELTDQA